MHASRSLAGMAIVLFTAVYAPAAAAQASYDVIRSFSRPPEQPTGPPVEVEPGVFAISMVSGGAFNRGVVLRFARQPDGSLTSAVLHAFNGADGAGPGRLMRGNDGALYGTTQRGGAADEGTAFRLAMDGQLTTLHSFSGDQAFPNGLMLRTASGDFYGTLGGVSPVTGKVFKLTPGGTLTIVPISIFVNTGPDVRLAETSTGQLYGINNGTFFRMQPDGEAVLLRRLSDDGYSPAASPVIVAGSDGNFYVNVIDNRSPPASVDVIVRLTPAGAFSIVRAFPTSANVHELFEASDGSLYGVASQTAQVFRLTKSGAFTTLHTFSYWDGYQPISLMQASTGQLYGGTIGGGTSNRGTLFEISSAGFAVRSHFSDPTPLNPAGTLVRGIDGALYGTSCGGGDYNAGTVFRITDAGALTVAHSFRYWDGICPTSGLTRTSDGTLWGTARASLFGQGTIFKISPAGVFTLIKILGPADGQRPVELCLASDGNLYGTTTKGGPSGLTAGTVFRVTPGGVFTVMHTFNGTSGLHHPWSGVVQGADGALYGTALSHDGGPFGPVGAFRVTLDGVYAEVAWGLVPGGVGPRLLPAADGGFFGFGGPKLFSVTPSGASSILYTMSASDGSLPLGDLVLAADGQLYGTAWSGGATDQGTLFRVTTTGVFEKLHDFGGLDGANPYGGLFESAPGVFYGTAVAGGPGNGGGVFRLVMNPPPF
jgi:uncharacterized repeat protein (TIGR03803 family)